MNVLGLSSFVHDSAACLIKHGELIANVEEERFNRIKHTDAFPVQSIKYVLDAGGIEMSEVDAIAFNWNPYKSLIAEIIKFALVPITYYKVYRNTNPPKNFRTIATTFKSLVRVFTHVFWALAQS